MRSYNIQGKIDLDAFDSFLRAKYPVKVISSAKNSLVLKIFGFYKFLPMEPFIFNEAVLSVKYNESSKSTDITFSIFTTFYLALFLFPLIAGCIAANSLHPNNFSEFAIFVIFFFIVLFFPGFLWAWFRHKRLILILSKKT